MPTEPKKIVQTNPRPAKFSLAANYDPELIPLLKPYPIDEVYGKFPADGINGGRPRYMATPLSEDDLRSYITLLDSHDIAFNYLLNGSCFGNLEWSRSWHKKMSLLLDKLGDMGVRRLTVSTPFLLELIKHRFPEFKVRVGIYAQVDTPRRARFWEDLGADAITLESFSINRNFNRLTTIRQSVQCELQLIANHVCLMNCPMQSYHQNGFAHASNTQNLFIDYCLLRCSKARLTDPAQFIKSAWIRPEDLSTYEAMGYNTFKLLERGIPSSELLRRVKAYSERRYDGNLADLLLSYGFKEPIRKESNWSMRHFWKPFQMNPFRLKPLLNLASLQGMLSPLEQNPVYIDTHKIPENFLDGFRNLDCASLDCQTCGYCARIAEKAVSIVPEYRTKVLSQYAKTDSLIATGKLWNVSARSTTKEFLDQPDCDPSLIAESHRFMEKVNGCFGGTRIVRRFLSAETRCRDIKFPLRILDIGSGSCDIPLEISRWARASAIPIEITCIEVSDQAIAIARRKLALANDPAVHLLQEDVFTHQPAEPYDCAVASMCFHHFDNEQILTLLQRLRSFVTHRVLINDLHRTPLASFGAGLLLDCSGARPGVRHDALLSIERGFKIRELESVLKRLDNITFSVKTAPWFRIAAVIQFKKGDNL
jgi:collagenase-like PrtC family protease